jgi:HSP20 family protein
MQNSLTNWNPWKELDQIQREMGRLFGRRMAQPSPLGYPAVNLWADDRSVVLTADVPGLEPEQLDVTINRNTVILSASPETEKRKEGETYYRRERPSASFMRTVDLPVEVDPNSAEADYSKGVLTLRMSRPVAHQPKKVAVRTV